MSEAPPKASLDEFVTAERIEADMAISTTDLQTEFVRQPGLVYFYTSCMAKAEKQASTFKLRLEATEAMVEADIRSKASADGEKVTEAIVKGRVRLDRRTVNAEQSFIRAREIEATLKGVVEAMKHKRDSLYLLGSMARDEMRAKLSVEGDLSPEMNVARRMEAAKERMASMRQ